MVLVTLDIADVCWLLIIPVNSIGFVFTLFGMVREGKEGRGERGEKWRNTYQLEKEEKAG